MAPFVPVLDVCVRHEHGARAVRSRIATEKRVLQPLASETQRGKASEADAATDGTRSIVANPLRIRAALKKDSVHAQRMAATLANNFQDESVPFCECSRNAQLPF